MQPHAREYFLTFSNETKTWKSDIVGRAGKEEGGSRELVTINKWWGLLSKFHLHDEAASEIVTKASAKTSSIPEGNFITIWWKMKDKITRAPPLELALS